MALVQSQVSKLFGQRWMLQVLQSRGGRYQASPFLCDVELTTKYEKTSDIDEWKFVERVLPAAVIPNPKNLDTYQSGWKPQCIDSTSPYFISRSRNHMMPVYLRIKHQGLSRHTLVKNIKGDIWELEKDIRKYLGALIKPKPLRLQVNEFAGKMQIQGDHVNSIKYWLGDRGF